MAEPDATNANEDKEGDDGITMINTSSKKQPVSRDLPKSSPINDMRWFVPPVEIYKTCYELVDSAGQCLAASG